MCQSKKKKKKILFLGMLDDCSAGFHKLHHPFASFCMNRAHITLDFFIQIFFLIQQISSRLSDFRNVVGFLRVLPLNNTTARKNTAGQSTTSVALVGECKILYSVVPVNLLCFLRVHSIVAAFNCVVIENTHHSDWIEVSSLSSSSKIGHTASFMDLCLLVRSASALIFSALRFFFSSPMVGHVYSVQLRFPQFRMLFIDFISTRYLNHVRELRPIL